MLMDAYVLHTRAFRDTSLIVELLTPEGRCAVLAKGARKNVRWKGLLQLFTPLLVTWQGKGELPLLTQVEAKSPPILLKGKGLLTGFYLNELLMGLLERQDPCASIFSLYERLLPQLMASSLEGVLRCFEKNLVRELGYGLVLDKELRNNEPINPEDYYEYRLEEGAKKIDISFKDSLESYEGKSLLSFHMESFDTALSLKDAKRLMRSVLNELLNQKPLKSRELFF